MYVSVKDTLTPKQQHALDIVLQKQKEIAHIQQEIDNILRENDINQFDLGQYKKDSKVDAFQNTPLP